MSITATSTLHETIKYSTLFASTAIAGAAWGISIYAVPLVKLAPPAIGIKQWYACYHRGAVTIPTSTLAVASGFIYLGDYTSAGLAFSIIPWTITAMYSLLSRLKSMAKDADSSNGDSNLNTLDQPTFDSLMNKFNLLHSVRALLLTVSAGTAFWNFYNNKL